LFIEVKKKYIFKGKERNKDGDLYCKRVSF
jgi:hypothetical protein